jgi:hypothetical protein
MIITVNGVIFPDWNTFVVNTIKEHWNGACAPLP